MPRKVLVTDEPSPDVGTPGLSIRPELHVAGGAVTLMLFFTDREGRKADPDAVTVEIRGPGGAFQVFPTRLNSGARLASFHGNEPGWHKVAITADGVTVRTGFLR
jgi:hypothetical protein